MTADKEAREIVDEAQDHHGMSQYLKLHLEQSITRALSTRDAEILRLKEQVKVLSEGLSHPDIKELDCQCGWYEPEDPDGDGKHICIKHFIQEALERAGMGK